MAVRRPPTFQQAALAPVVATRRHRDLTVFTLINLAVLAGMLWGAHESRREAIANAPFIVQGSSAAHDFHETIGSYELRTGVPLSVTIDGELWSIDLVDHFKDAETHASGEAFHGVQAETFCEHRTIKYITTDNPTIIRQNIMHEIFHAGACSHGGATWWNSINDTDDGHPGVSHLGTFMAEFALSNPSFMRWMEETNSNGQ